jgi:hypothetical protein
LVFFDDLWDDDTVHVYPPINFDITGNPNLAECKEFRWLTQFSPLPTSGAPTCSYIKQYSELIFNVKEHKDIALSAGSQIYFAIATTNPKRTPDGTANFWRAVHKRLNSAGNAMVEMATQVASSWIVFPQI